MSQSKRPDPSTQTWLLAAVGFLSYTAPSKLSLEDMVKTLGSFLEAKTVPILRVYVCMCVCASSFPKSVSL